MKPHIDEKLLQCVCCLLKKQWRLSKYLTNLRMKVSCRVYKHRMITPHYLWYGGICCCDSVPPGQQKCGANHFKFFSQLQNPVARMPAAAQSVELKSNGGDILWYFSGIPKYRFIWRHVTMVMVHVLVRKMGKIHSVPDELGFECLRRLVARNSCCSVTRWKRQTVADHYYW